jgi:hypothetical protein
VGVITQTLFRKHRCPIIMSLVMPVWIHNPHRLTILFSISFVRLFLRLKWPGRVFDHHFIGLFNSVPCRSWITFLFSPSGWHRTFGYIKLKEIRCVDYLRLIVIVGSERANPVRSTVIIGFFKQSTFDLDRSRLGKRWLLWISSITLPARGPKNLEGFYPLKLAKYSPFLNRFDFALY